ncbi:MAG: hypothetical protein HYY31_00080, partial [Chloroflexi bacterium]|nr:hypothetical protein [Chloroflexota bacterium]
MKFPQQWNVTKAAWQTLLRSVDAPTEYRLREALHRLGLREDAWVRTMGQIKAAIAHSSALVKEAAHAPLAHDQPILIWSVQGNLQNNVVEALLAHTLRLRGLEPRIFLCDELLPACEARNSTSYHDGTINQKANKRLCDRCFFNDRSIFNAFRLPYTLLSRYTSPEAVRRAQELVAPLSREEIFDLHYKGLHLGPIIKSSVVRFFLSLSLPEDRQTDELVHAYGASAVIMADVVDRVLDELRPLRIVTSHGLYVSWEILLEMAKLKGIPVFVFWLGKRKMTLHLNRGDNFVRALINEPASVWENVTPPADERKRVEEFLLGREAGREDRLVFYQGRGIEEREIARELQLDPDKPTLGLFPNVLWDSEVYYR